MACDDRQLTEAQRQAGYQNQRTGVARAVRPFSGTPTVDNLIDYINRELFPAVKSTRDRVNDVYLPAVDNAPSGNPLSYYFSTETAAADPTAGRARFDASPQNTATTIRVSESNGRLADVAPWLDVMAGGATSPLGTITVFDSINPARFIRFDLTSMTDQGAYWDLAVTPIESSHDDPFVEAGAVVLSFIPGVASSGATVDAGNLTPIAANTALGNPTASTAAPQAIAVAENSVLGRAGAAGTGNIESITVPGTGVNTGEVVFLQSSSLRNHVRFAIFGLNALPLMPDNRFLGNISGATARPAYTDLGDLSSNSITYEATGKTFVREALTGDVTALQNSNETTIAPGAVTNAKSADMAESRIKGRAEGAGTGAPQDLTPTQVVAIIDAESPTWTGSHSFTGPSFSVNASTGDVALRALDDVLLNASSGVAIVAGSTATGFPVVTVTPGDMLIRAADGINIEAEGTTGVDITAAGASGFTTTVGGLTLGAAAATHVEAATDVLVNATSGVAITAGSSLVPVTTVNDGNVAIRAEQTFAVLTGAAATTRFSIESNGEWNVNGVSGTAETVLTAGGADTPPTWGGGVLFDNRLRLNGVISPTAINANQNNYTPTGWSTANVVRLSTNDATPREITGAAAGGDGELKYLVNVGTGQIALQHESASSTDVNRFRFASLTVFALDPEDMVGIWYDGTSDRWRVIHALVAT